MAPWGALQDEARKISYLGGEAAASPALDLLSGCYATELGSVAHRFLLLVAAKYSTENHDAAGTALHGDNPSQKYHIFLHTIPPNQLLGIRMGIICEEIW